MSIPPPASPSSPPDVAAPLLQRYRALPGGREAGAERLALAQELAAQAPSATSWMLLAHERFSAFDMAGGHQALVQALACDPGFLPARWAAFQMPPAIAPDSLEAVSAFAERWQRGLAAFEAMDFRAPAAAAHIWGCVGQSTAFYRHYLGHDLDQQRRYGALVRRMMAALAPDLPARAPRKGRRRILFGSAWLREHTVTRLFAPLFEALPRHRFELHALELAGVRDQWTLRVARSAQVHAGPRPIQDWYRLIAALQPDVIVWLDVGMHPVTQGLAALRLAPVQATLWGHPVSTGLPTLDWFISAQALEPPDGQDHYSERLLCLPGLGHGLDPPVAEPPPAAGVRRDLAGSIELLCAQSVYKLMPGQDALFARILARLPQARLHLVPHPEPGVRDWLRARMAPTLAAHGVDADQRLVMHGYGSLADFAGLGRACDLNLDSIGWSGGMSAFDLLGAGVPTLTRPAAVMRSRQTAAMLDLLEAPELVAADDEDWVEQAVALATDPDRLGDLNRRLRRHRDRLYNTGPAIDALADFLGRVEPSLSP